MHANDAAFAPEHETAFAAAGACCISGAAARSSGACCNAGDTATISDVAGHLAHMDATLQLLAKNK